MGVPPPSPAPEAGGAEDSVSLGGYSFTLLRRSVFGYLLVLPLLGRRGAGGDKLGGDWRYLWRELEGSHAAAAEGRRSGSLGS